MKKIIFFTAFSLIIAAGLYFIGSSLFADNPGYVLIGIGNWSLESSLAVFSVVLCVLFFCLYILFRSLGWLSRIPGKAKTQSKISTVNRSQDALISGLVDSAEGNWEHAEKTLIKHAESSTAPLIHYLTAARAAQAHGAIEHRDEYLDQASKKSPGSEMAIGLTHAELCLAQQQYDQALTILTRLQAINHEHASVLKLLHQTYVLLGDWDAVKTVMVDLNNNQQVTASELSKLQVESYPHILSHAAEDDDIKEVEAIWDTIPEAIQQVNTVETEYYSAMILVGAGNQVEHDITLSLAKEWNQTLLILFGSIHSDDTEKQLEIAEQWGDLHPKDAVMMRVLGKLYIKVENYELADTYLTKSLTLSPTVTAYQLLGELMFAQGNKSRANELFKEGITLAANDAINPVERKDSINIVSIEPQLQIEDNTSTESVAVESVLTTAGDISTIVNPTNNNTPEETATQFEAKTTIEPEPIVAAESPAITDIADTFAINQANPDDTKQATAIVLEDQPSPPTLTGQITTPAELAPLSDNKPTGALEIAPNKPVSTMVEAMAAAATPTQSPVIMTNAAAEQITTTETQGSESVSDNEITDTPPLEQTTVKPVSTMTEAMTAAAPAPTIMTDNTQTNETQAIEEIVLTEPEKTEPEAVLNAAKEAVTEPEKKKKFLGFFKNK